MLVPVELKQEIIFFFSSKCIAHVKVEVRMKEKYLPKGNTSPCLPALSVGMASPDVEESMVEKHSCVGSLKRNTLHPFPVSLSSRLQLSPF